MPRGVYDRSKIKKNFKFSKTEIRPVKKVKAPPPPPPSPPAEEVYAANEVIRLDDLTRMNLLRLHAEVDATEVRIKMDQTSLALYLKSIDPEGKVYSFETNLNHLRQRLNKFSDEYRAEILKISEKYHIEMKDCSFDEETGTLHTHIEAPEAPKTQV